MQIIYHRCNSLDRVKQSLAYDGFECDVQLTKDRVPVLVHDSQLESGQCVSQLSLHALQQSLQHHVTTVEELCEWLSTQIIVKPFKIFWELKSDVSSLPKQLQRCLGRFELPVQHWFISFFPKQLKRMVCVRPHALLGLNIKYAKNKPDRYDFKGQAEAQTIEDICDLLCSQPVSIHMLSLDINLLEQVDVSSMLKQGLPLMSWTVNEAREVLSCCETVITDVPYSSWSMTKD